MWSQIGAFKTRSIRCLACKVSGTKFWVPDEPEIRIRFTDDVNEAGARFRIAIDRRRRGQPVFGGEAGGLGDRAELSLVLALELLARCLEAEPGRFSR